jgi:uncharacterized protein YjlB
VPDRESPNFAFSALLYRNALPADADTIEQAFAVQGWFNACREGIS